MKKILLVSATLSVLIGTAYAATPAAQTQLPPYSMQSCASQAPYGFPQTSKPNTIAICRQAYAVLNDLVAKVSPWEVYTLTPQHALGCEARVNAFAPDQSLPKGQRAELVDYAHSGYDTGHIANDADMSWDPTVQRESFILSNMAPQLPGLNRSTWKVLETDVRDWAFNGHTMTIYAGSIYDINTDKKIGPDNVVVPHSFYKIVIDDVTHQSLAFLFPHRGDLGANILPLQTTVSNIESLTGIIFPVPDSKTIMNKMWPVNLSAMALSKKTQCAVNK